jgi:ribosomal-protein-alanine N-acetyltransferase
MFELQRLRAQHEIAVLNFELTNRTYFAQSINDRGDAFFANFAEEYQTSLDEQASGVFAFHVLVGDDGSVVGRFNLYDITDSTGVVGYRVAQRVAGRGVATAALRDLCRMSHRDYGLRTLRAATSHENLASKRVLEKAGFMADGPTEVGGQPGLWYELDLGGI